MNMSKIQHYTKKYKPHFTILFHQINQLFGAITHQQKSKQRTKKQRNIY